LKLVAKGRANSRFLAKLRSRIAPKSVQEDEVATGFFDADLADNLSFADALGLLETLLAEQSGSLGSTSLSIFATDFRWRGAPGDSSGSLHFFDLKGWGRGSRKQRFSISAALTCRGRTLEDPAFLDALRAAAESTGIAFDQGRLTASFDPREGLSPEEQFAIVVGLEEALQLTGAQLRERGIDWRSRPGLMTYGEAVEERFRSWGMGTRVSLPGPVKRLIKSEFPEFALRTGKGLWFFKPLTDQLALHLVFDNDCLGSIGKGFTALLGVEGTSGPANGLVWRDNLFRVFGADRLAPCWTYRTADDLATVLQGLAALLRDVLPPFEASCRRHLDPLPNLDTLPSAIRRGPITARQGWHEALAAARAWSERAVLIRLMVFRDGQAHDSLGPGVGLDGRLTPPGHWSYLFRSSEYPDETLCVEVPHLGSIRTSRSAAPGREDLSLGDNWLDSDRALTIAEEKGGTQLAGQFEKVAVALCDLKAGRSPSGVDRRGTPVRSAVAEPNPSGVWWEIHYTLEERGRHSKLEVRFDAASGGHVWVAVTAYP
jgi:hypothetical protein